MTNPTVNSEPTVEEALKELREMFPVPQQAEIVYSTDSRHVQILVYGTDEDRATRVLRRRGLKLSFAMAQVRKWKQEQS